MNAQRRAAVLGAVGTGATTALTGWLVRASVDQWPGPGQVPLDGAVGFVATATAAALSSWAVVVLAAATVPLLGGPLKPERDGSGIPVPRGGHVLSDTTAARPSPGTGGPVSRVTAVLLAAATISLGPSAAQATPDGPPTGQVRHEPTGTAQPYPMDASGGGRTTTSVSTANPPLSADSEAAGADAEAAGPDAEAAVPDAEEGVPDVAAVPVPGWTPTPEPSRTNGGSGAGSASVDLVTTSPARTAAAPGPGREQVVVHRGDSLWSIAARHLGVHATDADVAEAWPRWYDTNREVVGDDPDHLLPGQVLVVPAGAGR
ncbi:LysM peptidoglycan-binding domain-containing protein [Ornithinimicrobium sp. W1665]|uniref:LysM peptidoglycan-binding domain-containing protein n=1 Tax=Ornithinimicrobium sp. W1665 TaxID=3416666 RepID=UPI003CF418A5